MSQPVIIILGPQGSGKGTQAVLLARALGYGLYINGDAIRKEITNHTSLGRTLKKFFDQGQLVPDDLILKIVENNLSKRDLSLGLIIDGVPRNFSQIKPLESLLYQLGLADPWAIYLHLSEENSVKRLASRKICSRCQRVFKPGDQGYETNLCPICQAKLTIRSDDQPDIIRQRLAIYHQETKPVIDYYKRKNRLIEIDAAPGVEEVYEAIIDKLKKFYDSS